MRLRPGEGDYYYDNHRTDDYDNDHHYDDHDDDKNHQYHYHNESCPRSRQNMLRILPKQQLPIGNMQGKQIRV
jgi:hypothetical protein